MFRITGLLLLFSLAAGAQLRLGKVFAGNMVLQRNKPVAIWGKAYPGEKVEAVFAGLTKTALTGTDSAWRIIFPGQAANPVPQNILVKSGRETLTLDNLLIGDVWVCIGQSNMQFSMQEEMHFEAEKLECIQPLLRCYNPAFIGRGVFTQPFSDSMRQRLTPGRFYNGNWQTCDSNNFRQWTAAGYYFGKAIIRETGIPVGLINLAIGGCPLEAFISADALKKNPAFAAKVEGNWLENDALPVWVRQRGRENVGGAGVIPGDDNGPNHGFKPGFAYTAGIEPLLQLPISGVLLYQGESNAQETDRVNEYGALQTLLVSEYRKSWHLPKLPFYWVQLSSIDSVSYKSQLWPQFRDEQRRLLNAVAHGGMAVCSDIGARNNVHPTNKKAVGERLSKWALHEVYHKPVLPSGPLPMAARFKDGRVIISMEYAGDGLKTSDGLALRGLSLDGKNEISGKMAGNTLEIKTPSKPQFIYYAWKPFTDANLVNSDGLPASTFMLQVR